MGCLPHTFERPQDTDLARDLLCKGFVSFMTG